MKAMETTRVSERDLAAAAVTDAELIKRFIESQDQQAFAALVLRFQNPLRKYATRLCKGDVHTAEDLVQDTFLRAFLALAKFRGESKFSTWLHRITFNLAMQKYRQREPNDWCSLEDIDEQEDILQPIENAIATHDLNAALNNITHAQERVIFLCVVGGHSHEHAAQVTGLPLGTVKTNIRRGKIQLKNHLHAWREAA